MHMLYNSDSFTVVAFDIPGAPAAGRAEPEARGGFEIVDKFAQKDIFIEGADGRDLPGRSRGADGR